jgi:pimeloyl-ACP methyl ester carboxylesterase
VRSRPVHARPGAFALALLLLLAAAPARAPAAGPPIDRKAVEALATAWAKARPKTAFETWDGKVRADLLSRAKALGPIPEGAKDEVADLLWKALRKEWPRADSEIATPYGPATWIRHGKGGRKAGLVLGLHGGGEGAGSAGEAAGKWSLPGCLGLYPQGIRLVHDTWNTVHGERFALSLIEAAKVRDEVDPDRVYAMGFSMGGTGSWFLAGRHPDLLAGAAPCAGVLMAAPKSQVPRKEDVQTLQHGLVPNVRNLAMYWFIGLADRNCMPGTYLYAWDRLLEWKAKDPEGYGLLEFRTYPDLGHAMPPGEPSKLLKWMGGRRREPLPAKVVWEQAEAPYPLPEDDLDRKVGRYPKIDFYWLRCDRPADQALVVAVRKGNEFDLSVSGGDCRDYTLWLDGRLVRPEEDVVVRCGGKEVYRGRPVPDVLTVLETLDARVDRTLTFDRRVRLGD